MLALCSWSYPSIYLTPPPLPPSLNPPYPQPGGFIDLRYVRMKQGHGELKSKLALDGGLFGIGDGVLPPPEDQEVDVGRRGGRREMGGAVPTIVFRSCLCECALAVLLPLSVGHSHWAGWEM